MKSGLNASLKLTWNNTRIIPIAFFKLGKPMIKVVQTMLLCRWFQLTQTSFRIITQRKPNFWLFLLDQQNYKRTSYSTNDNLIFQLICFQLNDHEPGKWFFLWKYTTKEKIFKQTKQKSQKLRVKGIFQNTKYSCAVLHTKDC